MDVIEFNCLIEALEGKTVLAGPDRKAAPQSYCLFMWGAMVTGAVNNTILTVRELLSFLQMKFSGYLRHRKWTLVIRRRSLTGLHELLPNPQKKLGKALKIKNRLMQKILIGGASPV